MAPHTPQAHRSTGSMTADMNVTPMLDVMLVLLIIFMASIAKRSVIDAHLPDPTPVVQAEGVPIVLDVGPRGYYAINQQPVDATDLDARLRALYVARPDKRIIVRGARDASYDQVLHAMDVARGAGVTVIGVDTRR